MGLLTEEAKALNQSTYNIPIAKPTLTGGEAELIQQALDSGWVSMGALTQQFEQQICNTTGAIHAVAVNSCTSALHLAMLVHQIGAGHDVICPSYSFIATANGIRHAGAWPCFVDIDPATLNLDPEKTVACIEECYTPDLIHKKTGRQLKAILLVHQVGIPADIDTFETIARQYGLILLEDNACGLGSVYKGKPLGSSGFCSTLSFHPRKVITTGEGGMLLTSNTNLAEQARVLRAHGMSISDFARHNASSTTYESYHVVGYNYRLTDIQAAIGIKQLEQLEQFVQRRLAIAMAYNTAFADMPELTLIQPAEYVTRWNVQSYPVRLNKATQADRDRLMEALQQVGIATRRGIPPIHQQPVYQTALVLPQTERVSQTSFFLPVYPLMQNQDVQHVIQQVKQVVSRYL